MHAANTLDCAISYIGFPLDEGDMSRENRRHSANFLQSLIFSILSHEKMIREERDVKTLLLNRFHEFQLQSINLKAKRLHNRGLCDEQLTIISVKCSALPQLSLSLAFF